jgi:hypothetical protein
VLLAGCYEYKYTPIQPVAGMHLALDLNDRGRVELAEHVGPEIATVEGVLVSAQDSQYVMNVARTLGFRGQEHKWNGEPVTIQFGYVGVVRERSFSTPRTVMLAGTITASAVAFVVTRSLIGNGSGGPQDPGTPPPNGQ